MNEREFTLDFYQLDSQLFERFCGSLLAAEGFRDVQPFASPGQRQRGIDWICVSPDGARTVAQVKAYRHPVTSASMLRNVIYDLVNGLEFVNAQRAILMLSTTLSARMVEELQIASVYVDIWDEPVLQQLLHKHEIVRRAIDNVIDADRVIDGFIRSSKEQRIIDESHSDSLLAKLDDTQPGKEGWRQFEDTCVEILSYAFVPPLRLPRIQSRTEDNLDRRDAIFPIGTGNAFWDSVKYEYSSRMVIAEFKNYIDPIGQGEVESLQQYLLPKAKRAFGLLCSRQEPSIPAIAARRRAWMLAENIILFLSDGDLKEIVRIRAEDGDPSTVLDAQMDEFFIKLAP